MGIYPEKSKIHSYLAQSVERMTVNHDVAGSSPAVGAKNPRSSERGFFICAARHNILCVAHATSFDRQVNIIDAHGTNERGCTNVQMM